jgi:hypothetical protein
LRFALPCGAAEPFDFPVYVASHPPTEFNLFANAGWDGNWYVGHNTCWIKKLPPVPKGNYARAYIGAKLGRAKVQAAGKKPWEKKPIPGEIFVALSSTSAWRPEDRIRLTHTQSIPWEADFENALDGTGEAQWFWTEVPLSKVNFAGDNFVAVYSPTAGLLSVSSSPVLAAGWGDKEGSTWLLRDSGGKPPEKAGDLGAAISYFQPAIALKLIPAGSAHPLRIACRQDPGSADKPRLQLDCRIEGDSIEKAWVESAEQGRMTWHPIGRPVWKAPYVFVLDWSKLPMGRSQLRVVAENIWGETSASRPAAIAVSPRAPSK